MTAAATTPMRILVVDDEADVRQAYRQVFAGARLGAGRAERMELHAQLFSTAPATSPLAARQDAAEFDVCYCDGASSAVDAILRRARARRSVRGGVPGHAHAARARTACGPRHASASSTRRIEIVICTAFSDVDPATSASLVPPEDKLSYLQKPFHPHEMRQMAIALRSKWRAERRIVSASPTSTR